MIDIVIDTETTGLDESDCQIVSIGWAFRSSKNPNQIISGNLFIRPDVERLELQSKHQLNEALAITGLTMDQITDIDNVPYYNAITRLRGMINQQIREHCDEWDGIRFLAYNRAFDYKFIRTLPKSDWITNRMPAYLFEEEVCDHYASHDYGQHNCGCNRKDACIMMRASERWGVWSDYFGSYRWLRLVDALGYTIDKESDDSAGEPYNIRVQNAHNSEADAEMALIVHEHLERIA